MVTSHHHLFIYSFAKIIKNPPFTHISWLLPCLGFIPGLTVSKLEVLVVLHPSASHFLHSFFTCSR